ncbi:histone-fold-containing protein [Ascodesmis nigricans]|uniref:DNA polymerase epsilon subunit D n=1 Tax=Ascodesmis nigricans TaxID=341454 RepID=A0A4S2N765_9PEZI|nr:histone-fold-containing protein [Ascodesmis nigricans]
MPPKTPTTTATKKKAAPKPKKPADIVPIEDLLLPRSLIAKIVKSVLPEKGAVQREAVTAIQEAATVFVSYVMATANEHAKSGGRKAITVKDLLESLGKLEYGSFVPRLEAELEKAEAIASRIAKRKKEKSDDTAQVNTASLEDESGRTPKRPRGDESQATVPLSQSGDHGEESSDSDEAEEAEAEDVDEVLEVSGEDADEDVGEMDDTVQDVESDVGHEKTDDEAIDGSDSD